MVRVLFIGLGAKDKHPGWSFYPAYPSAILSSQFSHHVRTGQLYNADSRFGKTVWKPSHKHCTLKCTIHGYNDTRQPMESLP